MLRTGGRPGRNHPTRRGRSPRLGRLSSRGRVTNRRVLLAWRETVGIEAIISGRFGRVTSTNFSSLFSFPFLFFSFRVHSLLHLYFFHDMPRGPRSKAHSMDGVMKRVFSTGSRVQDDKPNGATFLHGLGALASRLDGSRHFCIVCFARCKGALEHNLRGHHGVGLFFWTVFSWS